MENKKTWNLFSIIVFLVTLISPVFVYLLISLLLSQFPQSLFLVWIWPLLSIVLIVINIFVLKQAKRRQQKGKGFSIAGIVLAALFTLISILFSLMVIFFGDDEGASSTRTPAPTKVPAALVRTQTALTDSDSRWQVLLPDTLAQCKAENFILSEAFLAEDMQRLLEKEKASLTAETTVTIIKKFEVATGVSGSYSYPIRLASPVPISCTYLSVGSDQGVYILGFLASIQDSNEQWIAHLAFDPDLTFEFTWDDEKGYSTTLFDESLYSRFFIQHELDAMELYVSDAPDDPDLLLPEQKINTYNYNIPQTNGLDLGFINVYHIFQPLTTDTISPEMITAFASDYEVSILPVTSFGLDPY